jgi:hypothetical protein
MEVHSDAVSPIPSWNPSNTSAPDSLAQRILAAIYHSLTFKSCKHPQQMRYWWVNQNQIYRREISLGYLWSPKRNANKVSNPFYESIREVSPGTSSSPSATRA